MTFYTDRTGKVGRVYTTVDIEKNEQIEEEIKAHGETWCSPKCTTFLPDAYRDKRSMYGVQEVQRDYDLCHIWR